MSEHDLVAAARAAAESIGSATGRRASWLRDLLVAAGPGPGNAAGGALVADSIRRDAPLRLDQVLGNPDAARLTCHDGLARTPPELVTVLRDLAGPDGDLLDLGCGDGALAAATSLRARLVDRDVRAANHLRGPRCEVIRADATSFKGPPARVVLLSNVLHTSTSPATLVAHARSLVAPGGALVVREVALAGDRSGPSFGLAFGLSLLLFGDAELPTESQLAQWLPGAEVTHIAEACVFVLRAAE